MLSNESLSRRTLLAGAAALLVSGCSRSTPPQPGSADNSSSPASTDATAMTVYRDPSCGCCEAWAKLARKRGFNVRVVDDPDMAAVKRQLGVPGALASCHTSVVGHHVFEGHVPLDQVRRLLDTHRNEVLGLAVPGMPAGSPGMEMPDGRREPYQVLAFDQTGRTSVFFNVA